MDDESIKPSNKNDACDAESDRSKNPGSGYRRSSGAKRAKRSLSSDELSVVEFLATNKKKKE